MSVAREGGGGGVGGTWRIVRGDPEDDLNAVLIMGEKTTICDSMGE